MDETWKPARGFEGLYEISDAGRLRSLGKYINGDFRRYLLPRIVNGSQCQGYLRYTMRRASGKPVMASAHSLVLEAFVGPRPEGMDAAHLNGNSRDNRVGNLAWVTPLENESHKLIHGGRHTGPSHNSAKLNPDSVEAIRELRTKGWSLSRLGRLFGVCIQTVSLVVNGKTWNEEGKREAAMASGLLRRALSNTPGANVKSPDDGAKANPHTGSTLDVDHLAATGEVRTKRPSEGTRGRG